MSVKNWIYVCHPYKDDPRGNKEKVAQVCCQLKDRYILIAPQLFLEAYMDEVSERSLIMEICLRYIDKCDGLLICGDTITSGMQLEIQYAHDKKITVYSNVTEMLFKTGKMDESPPRCVHRENGI